ncbi:transmembrane protein 160 [Myiozetetes cayanensis]|uniref:transmembrane protein 160 n=1 Tax=Myiozetetes cayanensis TaxID=478635 RepID=UPI00215E3F6F|nr:transmembrane protein 160 [Myiozetetes cayanensis]
MGRGRSEDGRGLSRSWAGPRPRAPAPSELDRADAALLRKALEGAFLAWFRNGLLATGIGVIAFVQSDTGRDAAYGFFLLGGLCVSHGGVSYVLGLALLRRPLLLSAPSAAASAALPALLALLWAAALSLYVGRLEVEIVPEEPSRSPREVTGEGDVLDEHWDLLDERWDLLDERWDLLDERWDLLDECWDLLDEPQDVLDEHWDLLDERWDLLDECWDLLDECWDLLDECWDLLDEPQDVLD